MKSHTSKPKSRLWICLFLVLSLVQPPTPASAQLFSIFAGLFGIGNDIWGWHSGHELTDDINNGFRALQAADQTIINNQHQELNELYAIQGMIKSIYSKLYRIDQNIIAVGHEIQAVDQQLQTELKHLGRDISQVKGLILENDVLTPLSNIEASYDSVISVLNTVKSEDRANLKKTVQAVMKPNSSGGCSGTGGGVGTQTICGIDKVTLLQDIVTITNVLTEGNAASDSKPLLQFQLQSLIEIFFEDAVSYPDDARRIQQQLFRAYTGYFLHLVTWQLRAINLMLMRNAYDYSCDPANLKLGIQQIQREVFPHMRVQLEQYMRGVETIDALIPIDYYANGFGNTSYADQSSIRAQANQIFSFALGLGGTVHVDFVRPANKDYDPSWGKVGGHIPPLNATLDPYAESKKWLSVPGEMLLSSFQKPNITIRQDPKTEMFTLTYESMEETKYPPRLTYRCTNSDLSQALSRGAASAYPDCFQADSGGIFDLQFEFNEKNFPYPATFLDAPTVSKSIWSTEKLAYAIPAPPATGKLNFNACSTKSTPSKLPPSFPQPKVSQAPYWTPAQTIAGSTMQPSSPWMVAKVREVILHTGSKDVRSCSIDITLPDQARTQTSTFNCSKATNCQQGCSLRILSETGVQSSVAMQAKNIRAQASPQDANLWVAPVVLNTGTVVFKDGSTAAPINKTAYFQPLSEALHRKRAISETLVIPLNADDAHLEIVMTMGPAH